MLMYIQIMGRRIERLVREVLSRPGGVDTAFCVSMFVCLVVCTHGCLVVEGRGGVEAPLCLYMIGINKRACV